MSSPLGQSFTHQIATHRLTQVNTHTRTQTHTNEAEAHSKIPTQRPQARRVQRRQKRKPWPESSDQLRNCNTEPSLRGGEEARRGKEGEGEQTKTRMRARRSDNLGTTRLTRSEEAGRGAGRKEAEATAAVRNNPEEVPMALTFHSENKFHRVQRKFLPASLGERCERTRPASRGFIS